MYSRRVKKKLLFLIDRWVSPSYTLDYVVQLINVDRRDFFTYVFLKIDLSLKINIKH